ncbi:PQQ-binding-like beta-propeller repeat protein [Streptomyces caelestis]|uniref:outer membrane protein assembly factor BamB family protein n=1 Tax=Streptomyces caelestis TaxID=36816 RepID=UPI003665F9AD
MLLRELIDKATPRQTLASLSKPLHYSRARISEFCSGKAVPPLDFVEKLVELTVVPQERASRMRAARSLHKAAVHAPASAVVVPPPQTHVEEAASTGEQLVKALNTINELERAKASAEKLALFLLILYQALRHKLEQEQAESRLAPHGREGEMLAEIELLDMDRPELRALQIRVSANLERANRIAASARSLHGTAQKIRARLEEDIDDLRARGAKVTFTLSSDPVRTPGSHLDAEDVLAVIGRSEELLEGVATDLERLSRTVSEQTRVLDEDPAAGLNNPPEQPDNFLTSTDGEGGDREPLLLTKRADHRLNRRNLLVGTAAILAAAGTGYGAYNWYGKQQDDGKRSGEPSLKTPTRWTWRYRTPGQLFIRPVVHEGVVLAVEGMNYRDDGSSEENDWLGWTVYAVDASTGQLRWKTHVATNRSRLRVQNGTVFTTSTHDGSAAGQLSARDVRTGKVRWRYGQAADEFGNALPGPADLVYVTRSADAALHAVRARDGKRVWQAPVGNWGGLDDPVHVTAEAVLTRDGNDVLYAFAAKTGKSLWKQPLQDAPVMDAGPGRLLVAASTPGTPQIQDIRCIETLTGKTVWRKRTASYVHWPGTVYQNRLFLTDAEGVVTAFALDTGTLVWETKTGSMLLTEISNFDLEDSYHSVFSAPAARAGLVYVGTATGVHALDTDTGESKWRTETAGTVLAPAVATERTVYAASESDLLALDPRTGTAQWTLKASGALMSSPTTTDSLLTILDTDGYIYGLQQPAPTPSLGSRA